MPRNPNATRPKAKTVGASIRDSNVGLLLRRYAAPMSRVMTTPPIQKALKLPAVRPDNTLSDAPPSRLAVTTSRTWREWVEVKNVVTSGMSAPASVPQVMIVESFHHSVPSPSSWMRTNDAAYVMTIDTPDASQTSDVSGFSKFISRTFWYFALASASLIR